MGLSDRQVSGYAASLLVDWFGGRSGHAYRACVGRRRRRSPVFVADSERGGWRWRSRRYGRRRSTRGRSVARRDGGAAFGRAACAGRTCCGCRLERRCRARSRTRRTSCSGCSRPRRRCRPARGARSSCRCRADSRRCATRAGYASVIGGLSRWWTLITERVNGTVHVNSARLRRAPQSAAFARALFDLIGEHGEAAERRRGGGDRHDRSVDGAAAARRAAGRAGFAIVQAPPGIDPAEGTLMRRLVRKRLKDAGATRSCGRCGRERRRVASRIYDYAEHENLGRS